MNVKIEIVNENRAISTAEIDANEVNEVINLTAVTVFKKENDGKEPTPEEKEKLLAERKTEIYEASIQALANEVQYNAAVTNRLQPVSRPETEKKGEIEYGKGITLVVAFDIVPKLHLGKYIGVEVTKQSVEVTNEDVNAVVNSELNSKKQNEKHYETTELELVNLFLAVKRVSNSETARTLVLKK